MLSELMVRNVAAELYCNSCNITVTEVELDELLDAPLEVVDALVPLFGGKNMYVPSGTILVLVHDYCWTMVGP